MAVQTGLCRTWSETPKAGFLTTRLHKKATNERPAINCLFFITNHVSDLERLMRILYKQTLSSSFKFYTFFAICKVNQLTVLISINIYKDIYDFIEKKITNNL